MTLSKNLSKLQISIPFWISFVLLVVSLTQTGYTVDLGDKKDDSPAFFEFLIGWTGIFCMPYLVPWLANPSLIISWILFGKKANTSLLFSFLSVAFATSFLLFDKVPINEAPTYKPIAHIGVGYWLWLLSCTSFFLGTYIILVRRNFKLKKAAMKANPSQSQDRQL